MNSRFVSLFVCYLGRQHARLGPDRRASLFQAFAEGRWPPNPEFFMDFPEYAPWRDKNAQWWSRGADELERLAEQGVRFVRLGEEGFPPALLELRDPPWVLSFKGHSEALLQAGLSVVGAREPMPESIRWLEEHLASFLKCLPMAVASGGARGVDQAAHRVALRSGRPTVVFLPSGIGCPYPADLKDWLLPVCETGGAFVSEFHPRTPMRKWNFETRNRLIAGLNPVTLVVEAKLKSGTWVTARLALEEGRVLGCLPGSPWETSMSGNLELLSSGGIVIRDAQDLVMLLSREASRPRTDGLGLGAFRSMVH